MATHFSILAWKVPWTEKPGRVQFMGSQRVGHNWATSLSLLPDQEVFIFFLIHCSVRFIIWLKSFAPMSCLRWPEIFLIHSFWGLLVSNLCYSHITSWNVLPFCIYFRIIDVDIEIVDWFHRKNFCLRLCSFFPKYTFSVFLSVYCRQTISGFLYLARLLCCFHFCHFLAYNSSLSGLFSQYVY